MREDNVKLEQAGGQKLTVVANESFWVCNLPGGSSGVPFPVLTDAVSTVSATYGLAFQEHLWNGWSSRNAWLVIDRDGVIRLFWKVGDTPQGPDILKIVQDLR